MGVELDYHPRIIDLELKKRLRSVGAVVIEGPKACGKTATARQAAESEVLFDVDRNAREAVDLDPVLVLDGPTPRLLDEWQIVPEIWNPIRRAVDDRGKPGQFILTGSAVPSDDITRHTGAGRLSRIRMRPMSLYELGHSTGDVSLQALLAGHPPRAGTSTLTVSSISQIAAIGGWPGHIGLETDQALDAVRAYLDEIRRADIARVDGVGRDPVRVGRLLSSLARNVGTLAGVSTLAADAGGEDGPLARTTVSDYLVALERLMILEDQHPWAPHLRSKSRLRKAPKRHFVDPSLAAAALGARPGDLLKDFEFFGFVFESMVVRDLRVYAQGMGAEVHYYGDHTGLEVDVIIQAMDGRWIAVEVKLGQNRVDEAAQNLLKFKTIVDLERSGEPAMLAVIVGTGYSYLREDGVAVISVGSLGP